MYNFFKAFTYAWQGLMVFFKRDRNGKVQLFITIAVLVAGGLLGVSATEWMILLICAAAVLSFEMINAAIEKLCDLVHPEHHPAIKVIKDVSAGAVLWACICSTIIGCIIFIPWLIRWYQTGK